MKAALHMWSGAREGSPYDWMNDINCVGVGLAPARDGSGFAHAVGHPRGAPLQLD